MKDIDFDELDKAVNRFLGEDMAEKTQAAVAPAQRAILRERLFLRLFLTVRRIRIREATENY